MSTTEHGRFCWYDLMSTDPAGSKAFYAELLGWRSEGVPMGEMTYEMLFMGERPLGGIVPLDAGAGLPTHWIPYVAVDDIQSFCGTAETAGAAVCVPPTDIGPGIFSVVTDPQGGLFSPWQPKDPLPPAPGKGEVGLFCWSECMSTDAAAGAAFYTKVFGWGLQEMDMEIGGCKTHYRMFMHGEGHHGGIVDLPSEALEQGARTHWLNYVTVADVDATAEKASSLGASVLCPCTDIPETGRFCVIQDPQGGMLALFA